MPLNVNLTNERAMTAQELFEYHADRGRAAARAAHQHARAIGDVFGRTLYHAVAEKLEDVTEHTGEAAHYAGQALAERDADVAALSAEVDRLRLALSTCTAELRSRYVRSRKPAPGWLDEASALLGTPAEEEVPF